MKTSQAERDLCERVPACLGPLTTVASPCFELPAGAWDAHFHLFDPHRAPYSPRRKYSPPPAGIGSYLALVKGLGLERGMLVHANVQGGDNRPLIEALEAGGGRFAGVVCMPSTVDPGELREMHEAGVRGIRFAFNPQHGGEFDVDRFHSAHRICERFGWFLELHFAADDLPGLEARLAASRVPVVIDHMGRVDAGEGPAGQNFARLLALLRSPNVWIKLSGSDRLSRAGPPYRDVVPLARRLVAAAPDRMLWGTDWPHTGYFEGMPDDGGLLNLLAEFAPEEQVRNRILVDNPLRLVGEK